jgi:molecular chaperone DnaK
MKKDAEANADSDRIARERVEKLNEADGMIFQTESQLKELGEKLSDEHKTAIEYALTELEMAHQNQDLDAIQTGLDKINAAWKTATEAMYAQGEQGGQPQDAQPQGEAGGDQVQDVDYEEVK